MTTSEAMDEKWFKDRKRRAGVTNAEIAARLGRDHTVISKIVSGSQRMTMDWAKIFAEVLGVSLAEVLEKTGLADPQTAIQANPGFSDSDVTPFVGKGPEERSVASIAEAFGARSGVDPMRINARAMTQAGYLPGDYVLVDTHQADRVKAGDVVVAQVYSPRGARTVIRRYLPPFLIAQSSPGEDEPLLVVDHDNVLIRGKIVASWRT